jgi:hypothetical protein
LQASKLQDWPLLEDAVDFKIEEQRRFVEWWDQNVRPNYRPTVTVPDPGQLSMADIEAEHRAR